MTDTTETQEQPTFTQAELEAKLEEATAGLRAKVDELLGETKSAKQKARELEEAQQRAAEERAKEKGEFKELYEREQRAKAELAEKYDQTLNAIRQKEIDAATSQLAATQTRDTKRAELLRKELAQYANHTDDGVVFELGGVQVDSGKLLAHISEMYPFLVDGTGSTGGGATGSKGNGVATTGDFGGDRAARKNAIKRKFNLEE